MEDMKNCVSIKEATVPIISFIYKGQSFDVSLARLDSQRVPEEIDSRIPDDIIRNMEPKDSKSIGGRRDNMKVLEAVGQ